MRWLTGEAANLASQDAVQKVGLSIVLLVCLAGVFMMVGLTMRNMKTGGNPVQIQRARLGIPLVVIVTLVVAYLLFLR